MEFRWPAFIALWTLLVAPILASPSASRPATTSPKATVTAAGRPLHTHSAHSVRLAK